MPTSKPAHLPAKPIDNVPQAPLAAPYSTPRPELALPELADVGGNEREIDLSV